VRPSAPAGRRLLLVEDDLATSSALRSILGRRGWVVDVAGTLAEALSLLDPQRLPAWVMLDLMLPDGDGLTVLRKIRADGLDVKVVVSTAASDRQRLDAVSRLAPDLVLCKPIDLSELFGMIGRGD
jgi:DNA-binding response OmpR family regulator